MALWKGYFCQASPKQVQASTTAEADFSPQAIAAIRDMGAEYILVHEQYYPTREAFAAAIEGMERRTDIDPVATSKDDGGAVWVYRLLRP